MSKTNSIPGPTNKASLARAYAAALKREHAVVSKLTDKSTAAQLKHAWAVADATNAALRALQESRCHDEDA